MTSLSLPLNLFIFTVDDTHSSNVGQQDIYELGKVIRREEAHNARGYDYCGRYVTLKRVTRLPGALRMLNSFSISFLHLSSLSFSFSTSPSSPTYIWFHIWSLTLISLPSLVFFWVFLICLRLCPLTASYYMLSLLLTTCKQLSTKQYATKWKMILLKTEIRYILPGETHKTRLREW